MSKLATKANSSVLDKFETKISKQEIIATGGAVRTAKGFPFFISNEDMNNIIKIVESLKKSGLLIDGVTETVKNEIILGAMMAFMAASLLAPMDFSLIQSAASSLINAISGKGIMRAGKGQECGFLPLLALSLTMKVLGKGVTRAGRRYNNMDHMDKNF